MRTMFPSTSDGKVSFTINSVYTMDVGESQLKKIYLSLLRNFEISQMQEYFFQTCIKNFDAIRIECFVQVTALLILLK